MSTESLLARAYTLLDSECAHADISLKATLKTIADGAEVDVNWLAKFRQRRIREPGVSKVQRVHDFLVTRAANRVPASVLVERQHGG